MSTPAAADARRWRGRSGDGRRRRRGPRPRGAGSAHADARWPTRFEPAATTSTRLLRRRARARSTRMVRDGLAALRSPPRRDARAGAVRRRRLRPRRAVPAVGHRPAGAGRADAQHAARRPRWRGFVRPAVGCRAAGRPRGALAGAVHRGRARDITVLTALHRGAAAASPTRRGAAALHAGDRAASWSGRRASSSSPSARSCARAMRASATPPTTSSPTSRKAPAACATCRRCAGWRCASLGAGDLESLVALGQLGADELATLERAAARAGAPALRPAPGRRQARGAPALRPPEDAGRAPGPRRRRRTASRSSR